MSTISITSNEGALESASAVLEVAATNPEYNQPALRIRQAGKRGGAASIRIDDPNPDIEFVETDQKAPAGKYEIAVQSDKLQINGRNAIDWEERFRLDVWYVDHWSFGLDLQILLLTAWKVLTREGVNQPGRATTERFTGSRD